MQPVKLTCPECPRRLRSSGGELHFDVPPTQAITWRCGRGHAWRFRALTRDERRTYKREHHHSPPPVVATRWEDADAST